MNNHWPQIDMSRHCVNGDASPILTDAQADKVSSAMSIYSDGWDPEDKQRNASYLQGKQDGINFLDSDSLYDSSYSGLARSAVKSEAVEYFAIHGEITRSHQLQIDYWRGRHQFAFEAEEQWRAGLKLMPGGLVDHGEPGCIPENKLQCIEEVFVKAMKTKANMDIASEVEESKTEMLFHVPGFINEVMDLSSSTAAYPNRRLAFCGAITLLSVLVARKIQFRGSTPNIYVLGLANSGAGKDQPRKVNAKILSDHGLGQVLGNSFASGEGIEDAMFAQPVKLFQADEFDTILSAIASEKENRHAAVANMLLQFFTTANSTYYLRVKAGPEPQRSIEFPSLSIFATCIPSSFYDSLSAKMLSSGLVSRMIVVESGTRGKGQRPKAIEIPESISMQVDHWRDMVAGDGNMASINPSPHEMDIEEAASVALDAFRDACDEKYSEHEKLADNAGMAIWSRGYEMASKLSMLYAASDTPLSLKISLDAVEWATAFISDQITRLVASVETSIHVSEFDKLCQKAIKKIETSKAGIGHSELLKALKITSKEFTQLIGTLCERGQLVASQTDTAGRTGLRYFAAGK